jgi:uncharacterized protein YabE (DUF348 family)
LKERFKLFEFLTVKSFFLLLAIFILSVSVGYAAFYRVISKVELTINGETKKYLTSADDFYSFIKEKEIPYNTNDIVSPDIYTKIKKGKQNEFIIQKALPVHIEYSGNSVLVYTQLKVVSKLLDKMEIDINEKYDLVNYKPADKITENMKIVLKEKRERIIIEKVEIPFKTINIANKELESSKRNILQEGRNGLLEKTWQVYYKDGKELSRSLITEKTLIEPVNEEIEYGTMENFTNNRGIKFSFNTVYEMTATAYTSSLKDTGKTQDHPLFGITRSGMKAKPGVIAVDPELIPLGTKVYVEGVGDVPDYGYAIAADTGGLIKGSIIDIYLENQDLVDNWGRKMVKVYILSDQDIDIFKKRR